MTKIRILIVEHDVNDTELILYELRNWNADHETKVVQTEQEFRKAIRIFLPDIILSDYIFPSFSGGAAFKIKEGFAPHIPFIIVSGTIGEENSIALIKDGITDFVLKDRLFTLPTKIARALTEAKEKSERKKAEELVLQKEMVFRNTLDNMLEGAQFHDFDWKYIYVNDALVSFTPFLREELMGYTLMERYPGIEQTALFKSLDRCMKTRRSEHLESDFVFPDGSVKHFEMSIQPIPEGIFILSVDRTEQHKANEKLRKVTRLYAFNSAINQSIVHITDESELLKNACKVATEIGGFKMAWIGMFDEDSKTINLIHQSGVPNNDIKLFTHTTCPDGGPWSHVLKTGSYYNCADIHGDPLLVSWRPFAAKHGIQSGIVLPISKGGTVIGTFNLYSTKVDFADDEEIILLKEVMGDISFALDIFQNAKKHKETEALLVANEQRFRALIEKSPDMKTLANAEGKLVYGSPALTATLGRTESDFLNKSITDYIHPDYIEDYLAKRNEIMHKPGDFFQFKIPLLHASGNYIICQGTVTNMLYEPGVNAFVANFIDVTEKEATERQLQETNERLSFHVENTPLGFISWDNQLKVKTWSKQAEAIFGWTEKELVESGDSGYLTVYEEDQQFAFKIVNDLLTGKTISNKVQNRNYTKNGKVIWCQWFNSAMMDGNGNVISIMSLVQDITERKVMEENLLESEKKYRYLFENNPMPMWIIDLDTFKFLDVNKMALIQYGYEREEFLKMTALDIRPDEEKKLFTDSEHSSFTNASNFNKGIWNHRKKDQSIIQVEIISHEITFNGSNAKIILSNDVTKRKLAEKKLEQQNNELIKANFELDRFVYSVSHDLRSPLTAILGLTTFIEEETKESDTLEHAKMIKGRIMRLDDFIKNILSYSRNNRLGLQIKKVDVKNQISDIVAMLCSTKNTNSINFEINIDERKPFYSDTQSLNTVLENLISNAIKFQKPNNQENNIIIKGVSDDEFLTLSISDNGIGIAPQHHQKIFDMFYRLSGEVDGSGIGLYIAKEIVEKLHGTIDIESEKDKGTVFNLKIKNLQHDYEDATDV